MINAKFIVTKGANNRLLTLFDIAYRREVAEIKKYPKAHPKHWKAGKGWTVGDLAEKGKKFTQESGNGKI